MAVVDGISEKELRVEERMVKQAEAHWESSRSDVVHVMRVAL